MNNKNLIGISIITGSIVYLLYVIHANEYIIKITQRIHGEFSYPITNSISIYVPDGWFLEYSYTEIEGALLYGIFKFEWNNQLVNRINMAASFQRLGKNLEEVSIYQLKDEYRLSDTVYEANPIITLDNGMVGYMIAKEVGESDRSIYFPSENVMVYTDNHDIISSFFEH